MLKKLVYNFDIALEAIKQNAMRSFLTSLGIIFGVASVIAMLAIGRGAQQEVLQQMQLLGTNNVIIEPIVRQVEGEVQQTDSRAQEENRYSPGLTLEDMQSIVQNIANIESVSPEIVFDTEFIRGGRLRSGKLIGVSKEYFDINSFNFAAGGTFTNIQVRDSEPVCIIGADIENRFFAGEKSTG